VLALTAIILSKGGENVLSQIKTLGLGVLITICLTMFWVMIFYGIIAEQERKEGQKSNRKWVQERALNQWQTEQQPELMKAMKQAVAGRVPK